MATFETPALHYQQGDRDVYSFVMDLEEVKRYLPLRTADDANQIKDTNRALLRSHVRNIRNYLDETDEWVLPAITLAVTSDSVQFTPNGDTDIGTVRVSNDDDNEQNLFRIVDGQHRRHAIEDLLTEYEEKDPDRWTTLGESGLSVTLYAESDPVKIRQMFATMALSKQIDRNTRQQFDSSNPFNNAASYAMQHSRLLDNGKRVNAQRPSLQSVSEELLTHNDLIDIAIVVTLGLPAKQPARNLQKYHRTDEQQEEIYENMSLFLDEFLPECHQLLTDLMAGEIPAPHLPIKRAEQWILDPAFIKLIAGCYQNWRSSDDNTDALASHVRERMEFDRNVSGDRSSVEQLSLIDKSGTRPKPTRKTNPIWKEAAVKICRAAREEAN